VLEAEDEVVAGLMLELKTPMNGDRRVWRSGATRAGSRSSPIPSVSNDAARMLQRTGTGKETKRVGPA
jgi:hypothetical protein